MVDIVPSLSISVVSHRNGQMIKHLLGDLRRTLNCTYEILLTVNVPEDMGYIDEFSDLNLVVMHNTEVKGFGSNHNAAFHQSRAPAFLIVNPDIRLPAFDFARFLRAHAEVKGGAVSAVIKNPAGALEDSARRHPTFASLFLRFFTRWRQDLIRPDAPLTRVDWLAGMFVCFDRATFAAVGGFDESFFMYLEDADIGRKLARAGHGSYICTDQFVVHDAQRASKRSMTHLKWHISSAFKYFQKYGYL